MKHRVMWVVVGLVAAACNDATTAATTTVPATAPTTVSSTTVAVVSTTSEPTVVGWEQTTHLGLACAPNACDPGSVARTDRADYFFEGTRGVLGLLGEVSFEGGSIDCYAMYQPLCAVFWSPELVPIVAPAATVAFVGGVLVGLDLVYPEVESPRRFDSQVRAPHWVGTFYLGDDRLGSPILGRIDLGPQGDLRLLSEPCVGHEVRIPPDNTPLSTLACAERMQSNEARNSHWPLTYVRNAGDYLTVGYAYVLSVTTDGLPEYKTRFAEGLAAGPSSYYARYDRTMVVCLESPECWADYMTEMQYPSRLVDAIKSGQPPDVEAPPLGVDPTTFPIALFDPIVPSQIPGLTILVSQACLKTFCDDVVDLFESQISRTTNYPINVVDVADLSAEMREKLRVTDQLPMLWAFDRDGTPVTGFPPRRGIVDESYAENLSVYLCAQTVALCGSG